MNITNIMELGKFERQADNEISKKLADIINKFLADKGINSAEGTIRFKADSRPFRQSFIEVSLFNVNIPTKVEENGS